MVDLKLIVVGDVGCGKTSLIHALQGRRFDATYRTTTSHVGHTLSVRVNNKIVTIEIWDISSHQAFCVGTDVGAILGCFSIGDPANYQNVARIIEEAYDYLVARRPRSDVHIIPKVLIGTKSDLRRNRPTPSDGGQASSSQNVQETSLATGGAEAATSSRDHKTASASQSSEAEPSTSATTDKSSLLPAAETSASVSAPGPAPRVVAEAPVGALEARRRLVDLINAEMYHECSALTGEGVDELCQMLWSNFVPRESSCRESSSGCMLYCFNKCKCRRNQ